MIEGINGLPGPANEGAARILGEQTPPQMPYQYRLPRDVETSVLAKHLIDRYEVNSPTEGQLIFRTPQPTSRLFRNELEAALGDWKIHYDLIPPPPGLNDGLLFDAELLKGGGIKHDQDKARLDLLSGIWLTGVGKVLAFGAKKYAAHNWRKGLERSRLLGAALRHIFSYLDGEDLDAETSLLHLYHASCCLMFASELHETRRDTDDRWKTVKPKEMKGTWVSVDLDDESGKERTVLMFQPDDQSVVGGLEAGQQGTLSGIL